MAQCPRWLRAFFHIIGTLWILLGDSLQFLRLCLRFPTALAAENLFLRKQLALYQERHVTPRRTPDATRLALTWLSGWFGWRQALVVVQPATRLRWHREGFRLFWRWKSQHGLRVDRWVATHATAGLAWYREKVLGFTGKPELQFELIHENHDVHAFLTWCQANLARTKDPEMFHKSVMAAVYHTTIGGDAELYGFWKRVAGGKAQNDADSIEYKLADFLNMVRTCRVLEDWPPTIRRNLKASKRGPSDLDIFATCLRGFSAFLKGQKVGDIFTPSKNRSAAQLVAELSPPQAA
jgi:hypothetical protein